MGPTSPVGPRLRLHSFCAGPLMRQCQALPLRSSSLLSSPSLFPSPQSRFPDFKTVSRPNFSMMSSSKQVELFEVTHGTVLVCTIHLFHYRQFSALFDFLNVCACGVPVELLGSRWARPLCGCGVGSSLYPVNTKKKSLIALPWWWQGSWNR